VLLNAADEAKKDVRVNVVANCCLYLALPTAVCTLHCQLLSVFKEISYFQALQLYDSVLTVTLTVRSTGLDLKLLHVEEGRAVRHAL